MIARQRLRILAALGLPASVWGAAACQPPPTAPEDPEVPMVAIQLTATATSSASAAPETPPPPTTVPRMPPSRCAADNVREYACGQVREGAGAGGAHGQCSRTGSGLQRSRLESFLRTANRKALNFDAELTRGYRTGIQVQEGASAADGACCFSRCVPVTTAAKGEATPKGWSTMTRCFDPMAQGTAHPAIGRSDCPAAVGFDEGPKGTFMAPFDPGSTKSIGQPRELRGFRGVEKCCYTSTRRYRPMPILGRPLRRADGTPHVAEARERHDWAAAVGPQPVPESISAELAAHWARDAALEHASVAAFADVALQLMALGAPAALIADAHRAALDEIEHARVGYGLASHYGHTEMGPGPLAALPRTQAPSFARLVEETFNDGCIGETVAAAIAAEAARVAQDPAVARALATIAEDEQRHAELGWRIVAWAIRHDADAKRTFDRLVAALRAEADALPIPEPGRLATHGVLSDGCQRGWRARVIEGVVGPCARALLDASSDEPQNRPVTPTPV